MSEDSNWGKNVSFSMLPEDVRRAFADREAKAGWPTAYVEP